MSTIGARSAFLVMAVVVVGIMLASSVGMVPSGPTTAGTQGQTKTSAASIDGLKLTLVVSASDVGQGESIVINVTEMNTNTVPLNVSSARDWAVTGLRMGDCYSSVYPFGVAVYSGHYTGQNLSSGTPLNLYPLVPCPLFIRYISGYYFQGSSDVARVLPGSGSGMAMTSGVTAHGSYTAGNSLTDFAPGRYTVVAGDEWGALALLYFVVQ